MTNQVQQVSSNLPSQSQKHHLSLFVETKDELAIIKAIENSVTVKKVEELKQEESLLSVITRWRMNLGISSKNEEQKNSIELALVRDFILDNFYHITLDEIELAYTLALTQRLDDCDYFGYFSPLYVGKVLNSYLYYRKMKLAEAIRKQEKHRLLEIEKSKKPTPEEEAKLTQEIFIDFYNKNKEGLDLDDVFNICWKYLRNQVKLGNRAFFHRWTNPVKQDYEEAIEYAQKFVSKRENAFQYYKETGINRDEEVLKLARNYCIKNYFDDVQIEHIVKNIKPEHFS